MDIKTLNGKVVTLLNLRNLKVSKVVLRGSTKKFLRYTNTGGEGALQTLKEDYNVFTENDFQEVNEVAQRYLTAKKDFLALSATAI
ncbi:hypothetical protein LCGC14_1311440 [marine sediment metagenome]|uniref:Uncharacterized protein n=1 Tax=marine sediment metagenome TaxID=412755 RepID=A0A0F9NPM9_9ZZZZ